MQWKYLNGDIQKDSKNHFQDKVRVKHLFGYLKEFPASCWRGTRSTSVDYMRRDEPIHSQCLGMICMIIKRQQIVVSSPLKVLSSVSSSSGVSDSCYLSSNTSK